MVGAGPRDLGNAIPRLPGPDDHFTHTPEPGRGRDRVRCHVPCESTESALRVPEIPGPGIDQPCKDCVSDSAILRHLAPIPRTDSHVAPLEGGCQRRNVARIMLPV